MRWRGADATPATLYNNAGHDDRHTMQEVTPEFWDDRLVLDLTHHCFAIQAVRRRWRRSAATASSTWAR